MNMEAWTRRHEHGDMDREAWTLRHEIKILNGKTEALYRLLIVQT
jgi:hypothetical protein